MGLEAELADDGVEEASPLGVVRIDDFEDRRDVGLDVNRLEGDGSMGWGWWWRVGAGGMDRRSEGSTGGGGGSRGTTMVELLELEQGIDIHSGQRKRR